MLPLFNHVQSPNSLPAVGDFPMLIHLPESSCGHMDERRSMDSASVEADGKPVDAIRTFFATPRRTISKCRWLQQLHADSIVFWELRHFVLLADTGTDGAAISIRPFLAFGRSGCVDILADGLPALHSI